MQPLPLLHQAVDVATSGRRRCRCYTSGRRRCYLRPQRLLHAATAVAASYGREARLLR
jgi:hypothetical protein